MRPFALALLATLPALCQPVQITLDPGATKINFTLGDVLHTVHGVFKLTKGDLWFDPGTGKAGGLLVVDAATGNSGSNARDTRMDKNILQTDQYSTITFTPDRVEGKVNLSGDSTFQLHGLFAIHGSNHELTMDVKAHITGNQLSADASFDVPYVKWGLKNPSTFILRVSETVQIAIEGVGHLTGT